MRRYIPFVVACFFFLILKGKVLVDFALVYTDHDQCTLWHAATEALHGRLHEPCFYGQSYNSNLEAWLAVPLLWLKIPVEVAVPLVTSLLASLLFLLPAVGFLIRGNLLAAWSFIIMGFLSAADLHLIMSMPRGFINGLFVVVCGYFFYLISEKRWTQYILFFSMSLGFWINPNSIVLSAAIFLFDWCQREGKMEWYMAIGGTLTAMIYKIFTFWFYSVHPLYDYHKKKMLVFEWDEWSERMVHLDHFFFNKSWLFLLCMALSFLLFLKNKRTKAILALLFFVIFFCLTIGMERIGDGIKSIYYHPGRMYLGMPLAVALITAVAFKKYRLSRHGLLNMALGFVCLFLLYTGITHVDQRIVAQMRTDDHGVVVERLDSVKLRFQKTKLACDAQAVDLVVFTEKFHACWIDTYAIPALSDGKINTIDLREDRRGWRFEEERLQSERHCLVMGCGDPDQIRPAQMMMNAGVYERITSCYFLQTTTNVPDHFRPMLKHVRYGY
jgi:hypothetical protein